MLNETFENIVNRPKQDHLRQKILDEPFLLDSDLQQILHIRHILNLLSHFVRWLLGDFEQQFRLQTLNLRTLLEAIGASRIRSD